LRSERALSTDHRFERGAEIAIVLLGIIYELRSVRKPGQHFEGFYQVAARKRNRYVQHTRSSTIILLDLELPALWPQSKDRRLVAPSRPCEYSLIAIRKPISIRTFRFKNLDLPSFHKIQLALRWNVFILRTKDSTLTHGWIQLALRRFHVYYAQV